MITYNESICPERTYEDDYNYNFALYLAWRVRYLRKHVRI